MYYNLLDVLEVVKVCVSYCLSQFLFLLKDLRIFNLIVCCSYAKF